MSELRDRLLNRLLSLGALAVGALLVYSALAHPPASLRSPRQGLLYYGLPALLAALLFLARGLPTALKGRLIALSLALGGSLYLAEGVLVLAELLNPHPPFHRQRMARAAEEDRPFDRRPKLEVVLDLRDEGTRAYPIKYAHQWIPVETDAGTVYPLSGLARTYTVVCNETGEYLTYTTDEHGFANPPGLHAATGAPLEIAVVGDSHAHGECVAPDESAAALLRQHFPRTLNLGVGGAGPLTLLALLREYALPLRPRVVLWFYYEGNDTNDLQGEQHLPQLQRYRDAGYTQGLRDLPREEMDRPLAAALDREIHRPLNRFFRKTVGRGQEHPLVRWALLRSLRGRLRVTAKSEVGGFDEVLFRQILETARDETAAHDGQLVFVYLPGFPGRPNDPNETLVEHPHRRAVLAVAGELGLPVIDVRERFLSQPDPPALFPFRLPGHYTPEGYRLVAETILQNLNAAGSIQAYP
jgi:hypothetical protein